VEDATTLSWSSAAVSEWASAIRSIIKQYNLTPVKEQWCYMTGNVTTYLSLHWPRIIQYPPRNL